MYRRSKLHSTFLPAALVLAGMLTAGCDSHPAVPVDSARSEPAAISVKPRLAAPPAASLSDTSELRAFTTSGPLVAEQQADIAAERDGRVIRVGVQIGDRVRRGQILAVLDDRSLHAAYESQKAKVTSLEAQVNGWVAEQKSAEADLRRADIMRAEKIRSEEDWEHVKYKLDETIAEVARYRADRQAGEADLHAASLALEQSRIVAPFDGVVGRSSLRTAQEVKKGDVLLWITATAPLRILFTVPESAMAVYTAGVPIELTTPNYPQLRQRGHIFRVSPVVDPASASLQVIGVLDNPSPLLKPGMTMQVAALPTIPGNGRRVR